MDTSLSPSPSASFLSSLSDEQKNFYERSYAIFEEAHQRALTLSANTVQVWPGGATFSTIQAAIDSIKDASQHLEYQVAVGPGTYNERVSTKEYIYIVGADPTKTTIAYQGAPDYTGTVQAMTNGGISQVRITAIGAPKGSLCIGIELVSSGNYHIRSVKIDAEDANASNMEVRGITNKAGATTGTIMVTSCTVAAITSGTGSSPVAIEGFMSGFNYMIDGTAFYSTSKGNGIAGRTTMGSTLTLSGCTIIGQTYALQNTDDISPITANGCDIKGPISKGVVVNP